jgi:hypothetical protein
MRIIMCFCKTEEEYFRREGLTLFLIKRSDLPVGSDSRAPFRGRS